MHLVEVVETHFFRKDFLRVKVDIFCIKTGSPQTHQNDQYDVKLQAKWPLDFTSEISVVFCNLRNFKIMQKKRKIAAKSTIPRCFILACVWTHFGTYWWASIGSFLDSYSYRSTYVFKSETSNLENQKSSIVDSHFARKLTLKAASGALSISMCRLPRTKI